jgi:para-aminobenzoate synthetase component I
MEITAITNTSEQVLFKKYKNKPYFIYLDSSDTNSKWSQFSFMCFEPMFIIESHNGLTSKIKPTKTTKISGNPFDILNTNLKEFEINEETDISPFIGGAVGYISYEATQYLPETIPSHIFENTKNALPEIWFGFYNQVIVINKKTDQKWYIKTNFNTKKLLTDLFPPQKIQPKNKPTSNFTKEDYLKTLKKTKDYIKEGDIYQANISHRFSTNLFCEPLELYQNLRAVSPAPYSAFLNCGNHQILSSSPELFINIENNKIITRPIKGTIAKTTNQAQNKKNIETLKNSEKDKAELTMIIDLERNDLGQICKYGTVSVPEYITLEEYSHVYHLVSTVKGTLKDNISSIDAIKPLLPGGSITGAPKIRAMEIISELETVSREIYTGCIGYIGFNRNASFNIAIRTIYTLDNQLHFHVGGGIVADSDPESEWEETLTKAAGIIKTISQKTT